MASDFKTPNFFHQDVEFEVGKDLEARALLWQMRTGKSKATIDKACHNAHRNRIGSGLIVAPSGVHTNWIRRELPRHSWESVPIRSLAWRSSEVETPRWQSEWESLLRTDSFAWFAVNYDGMITEKCRKYVARFIKAKMDQGIFMVADEAHGFGRPGSKRTHMARALFKRGRMRQILTGTPIHNSPLQAFSQFELLKPEALGFRRFSDFKAKFAVYETASNRSGRQYQVLSEYQNLELLRERMAPWSSVVLRSDCEDLPDLQRDVRYVEPSPEQLRVYRRLMKDFQVDLSDDHRVSIGEASTKINKLQQVLGGFVIDEAGRVHDIPGRNPRLEALSDEVAMSPGKSIVWCMFHEDLDRVARRLRADGHTVVEYHGRVKSRQRDENEDRFRDDPSVGVLVGQYASGGQGLDLSAASNIFNYSHTFNAIHRNQSEERATKMKGMSISLVDFVVPDSVDEYITENVTDKFEIADMVSGWGLREALKRMEL